MTLLDDEAVHGVDPGDAVELGEALRDLALDPERRQCMARSARDRAERFSWWFTSLMHRFPDNGEIGQKLQEAELDYITAGGGIAAQAVGIAQAAFGTTGSVAPTAGRVVNRSGSWTFSYSHQGSTAPVAAGDYQTTVTYTASKP